MAEPSQWPDDEVAAWVCLKHDEDLAAALRRNAVLHHTRRQARAERRTWPTPDLLRVIPLVVSRRGEPKRKRRFRRVARGTWMRIRCVGCGYTGEMVDVHRCTRCDGVLCSRKCCDAHTCRRRLPHEQRPRASGSLLTPVVPSPPVARPAPTPARRPRFARYAEGAWLRIRCSACGYVGEMIDVFRCSGCDGILCGRACRDAHVCQGRRTGT